MSDSLPSRTTSLALPPDRRAGGASKGRHHSCCPPSADCRSACSKLCTDRHLRLQRSSTNRGHGRIIAASRGCRRPLAAPSPRTGLEHALLPHGTASTCRRKPVATAPNRSSSPGRCSIRTARPGVRSLRATTSLMPQARSPPRDNSPDRRDLSQYDWQGLPVAPSHQRHSGDVRVRPHSRSTRQWHRGEAASRPGRMGASSWPPTGLDPVFASQRGLDLSSSAATPLDALTPPARSSHSVPASFALVLGDAHSGRHRAGTAWRYRPHRHHRRHSISPSLPMEWPITVIYAHHTARLPIHALRARPHQIVRQPRLT